MAVFCLPSEAAPVGRESKDRADALAKAEPLIKGLFTDLLSKPAGHGVRTRAVKDVVKRLHNEALVLLRASPQNTDGIAALLHAYVPVFHPLSTNHFKPFQEHSLITSFNYDQAAAKAIADSLAKRM